MTAAGDAARAPLDELDVAVFGRIRQLYTAADPVPPQLYELVRFAFDLQHAEEELATMRAGHDLDAAVRGERARTLTFESNSFLITVTIGRPGGDTVRLDGWIAPPGGLRIELRSDTVCIQTMSDEHGRFVFDGVARGAARLVVYPTPGSAVELTHAVRIPPIVL
jgi:hypothetical protein